MEKDQEFNPEDFEKDFEKELNKSLIKIAVKFFKDLEINMQAFQYIEGKNRDFLLGQN